VKSKEKGKSENHIEYNCVEYDVKLTDEIWKKLTDWIGRGSFGIAYDKLSFLFNKLEHEHNAEKKNTFFLETLDLCREKVLQYYTYDKFPEANMDYVNFSVDIFRRDVQHLFPLIFNPHLFVSWAPRRLNPQKVIGSRKELKLKDWQEFIKLYNQIPPDEIKDSDNIPKLLEKSDYYERPWWTNEKIEAIFADIVIYWELHKLFKKSQENEKPKTEDNSNSPQSYKVKPRITEKLYNDLKKNGYFNLKMIKELPLGSEDRIIDLLIQNDTPYQIAFLEYTGFIKHLKKEYCQTQKELVQVLSEMLNTTTRTVQGNIHVLNEYSKEDKERYTAHKYKDTVENDYQKLK
jgi:hypothetical protein